MSFDDLHLDRPPAPRRAPARSATSRWVILGAGTVIVGALLALWWMSRAQADPAALAPTTASEAAPTPVRPKPEPLDLPPLATSDAILREMVTALSNHPLLARAVMQEGVVRAGVLAIVQIGDGRTPAVPLAALRTTERLRITGSDSGTIDPASYARWDGAVGALRSINPSRAAQVYVNVKRLFDEAYRELGYTDGNFDDAIVKAIRMLTSAPTAGTDAILLKRPAYFEHENAALRALPPVQKQLLLTGPENQRQILAWLRQFAQALELKID